MGAEYFKCQTDYNDGREPDRRESRTYDHSSSPHRLVIGLKTRRELDAALDGALGLLKPAAMAEQVGILVTRLSPGCYEARLNGELPPGTIRESRGTSSNEPR